MTPAIETARDAIRKELEPVIDRLSELKAEADTLRGQKDQLDAALKALNGHRRTEPKQRRKSTAPTVKKQDVIAFCQGLLAREHAIALDEIEERAAQYFKEERGCNLSGYALRFKEAVRSEHFETTDDRMLVIASTEEVIAVPDSDSGGSARGQNEPVDEPLCEDIDT